MKKKYYNSNIQMHPKVIDDICKDCVHKKMLVWGLGYDTPLWWNVADNNTYFIESKDMYIELNKDIPDKNIVKYTYPDINVRQSLDYPEKFISRNVPESILKLGYFDVIIIDGPYGNSDNGPGRLLPIYWSLNYLSKPNTVIYIDDSNRELEAFCIKKYCKPDQIVKKYPYRKGTIKYIV